MIRTFTTLLLSLWFGAHALTLDVPLKEQEESEWCWAAVSQAILEYYGVIVSQTEIAEYGTGGKNTWNYLWGRGDDNPRRYSISMILDNWGEHYESAGKYVLSLADLTNEIDVQGNPFVINIMWNNGGGHYRVVHGVSDDMIAVMDPWPGTGYSVDSYDWVVQNSRNRWENTLLTQGNPVTLTIRPDGRRLPTALTRGWNLSPAIYDMKGRRTGAATAPRVFPTGIYSVDSHASLVTSV